jgi:hypothetical protein
LDAERELAAQGSFQTPKKMAEQIAREAVRVREALCPGEPLLGDAAVGPGDVAVAWCPTPSALARISRAGLCAPRAPSLDVLRRVNHRRFALELAQSEALLDIAGALSAHGAASRAFETERAYFDGEASLPRALESLERQPAVGTGFRLKRSYGFAGKGQWRLGSPLRADDHRWLSDALRLGGCVSEPEVELITEISQHGYVDDHELILGEPCRLECDRYGAPTSIARAERSTLDRQVLDALRATLVAVAEALRAAGYFGPFGLDSRLFGSSRGPGVTLVGDLNARFTMGWSVGLGEARETALARLATHTQR